MILWIRLYSIDNVVGHYNIPLGCPLNTVFTVLSYCFICCLLLRNSKINVKCSPYYKKPTKNVRFVVLSYVKTRRYIFNNHSSSTNGLWVNSPSAFGLISSWLRGHEGERNDCFSKIQLVGQNYRDKTTLASKTRFSRHCFGFQSRHFSLLAGYNI